MLGLTLHRLKSNIIKKSKESKLNSINLFSSLDSGISPKTKKILKPKSKMSKLICTNSNLIPHSCKSITITPKVTKASPSKEIKAQGEI